MASDAEFVAVWIGHHPPLKAADFVVLDLATAQFDDPRCRGINVFHAGIEMEAPSTWRGIGDSLKGNRITTLPLSSQPDETVDPMSDFDSEELSPESRQLFLIGCIDDNR